MRKQLIVLGIILLFVCVGLSGCDTYNEDRTGISVLGLNFIVSDGIVTDTCASTYPQSGTVWVNFTITNYGGRGTICAYARVYQRILNYQSCGNGNIYNQTQKSQEYTLDQDASVDVRFVFTGINCTTGTACHGNRYWISNSPYEAGP